MSDKNKIKRLEILKENTLDLTKEDLIECTGYNRAIRDVLFCLGYKEECEKINITFEQKVNKDFNIMAYRKDIGLKVYVRELEHLEPRLFPDDKYIGECGTLYSEKDLKIINK
jgi:hypothetical protein